MRAQTDADLIGGDDDHCLARGVVERIGTQALISMRATGQRKVRWAEPIRNEPDPVTGFPKLLRRKADGAEMILVPGGTYWMGAVPQDETALDDEKPRHRVELPSFYMDVNEITVAQFQSFVASTSYVTEVEKSEKGGYVVGKPPDMKGSYGGTWRSAPHEGDGVSSQPDHPVTQVTWNDAVAFSAWAKAELPSEAQFEYVLRGGTDGTVYPWGDALVVHPPQANLPGDELIRLYPGWKGVYAKGHEDAFPWTAPVRSFKPNTFGLYDLSGNVSEWCRDPFVMYDEDPSWAYEPEATPSRVMRGASWYSHIGRIRCSWRTQANPGFARSRWGFRCAKSLPARDAR